MLTNRLIDAINFVRSLSKSPVVEFAERSSGAVRELGRKGISRLKNIGLKSEPMMFAGNDARFGLMTPIAISMLHVQCARVWARDMLPHCRTLSERSRVTRCLISFAESGWERFFIKIARPLV